METNMLKVKCAYEPCQCTLLDDQGVMAENVKFCSEGCAAGRGCDCPNCNCANSARHQVTSPHENS